MKKEQFYELLGDIDEKNIKAAKQPISKKNHIIWIKFIVPFAACFVLILGIGLRLNGKNNPPPTESSASAADIALEHKNINIYYVNNNEELLAVSEYLPCSPEEIFKEWKNANNIGNEVELIKVEIKNNGTESKDSSTASYTVGDSFIMNVIVTENLKNYFSEISEDKLLESLELTLTEYNNIQFDEYYIHFE